MIFIPALLAPSENREKSYWFCFQNNRVMVYLDDRQAVLPLLHDLEELAIRPVRRQYLGTLDGVHCYSAELPLASSWPEGTSFLNLIELNRCVTEPLYRIAIYAHQVVAWDRDHQYCGSCGAKTEPVVTERAKKCAACGSIFFPRITPAIMVAILNGNKILLAKNKSFPSGFYSVLAGFVEPGERLEECIAREVAEEVGLEISNLRYFNSQPWPFPNSLMIAFIADYAAGEIRVDNREIIEAGWFAADELPKCPTGTLSVAGRLIDWFKNEYTTH
jgi:NAD+ diphosphatase